MTLNEGNKSSSYSAHLAWPARTLNQLRYRMELGAKALLMLASPRP